MDTRKVLLVGWDGADWKIIHPLLDAGKMPNLAALIENGVMGNLSSLGLNFLQCSGPQSQRESAPTSMVPIRTGDGKFNWSLVMPAIANGARQSP